MITWRARAYKPRESTPQPHTGHHWASREHAGALLQPGRVIGGGEPVGQLGEADPGAGRCPLDMLVAIEPDLHRVGEVRADLDERRPPVLVPDIEVVAGHPPLGFGEGELRGLGRVGVTLARIPYQLELLRPADCHHPRPASPRGPR